MEILNQSPIMEMDPSYKSLALKLLVAMIIGFFATVFCVCCGGDTSVIVTGGFTALCAIALFVLVACAPEVPTDRNEYIVKIDDASFVEIYEKYEVVEQKGDVWILQDKEIEE
jgi:hypothetical protein